jgi:hypothetical protein
MSRVRPNERLCDADGIHMQYDSMSASSVPESWRPLLREADLARHCLASGLRALLLANHMEKGLFSAAFFNLSMGLERLLKLIYILDRAVRSDGVYPSNDDLRNRFGHDLAKLYEEALAIRAQLADEGEQFDWVLPDPELTRRIVAVLTEIAKITRYYNLDYLTGRRNRGRDPIEAWTDEVARYLMSEYPARLRRRDEDWAAVADELTGNWTVVRQESESGLSIETVSGSILHGRRGEWIQRQATSHCAFIVRDLAELLWVLEHRARVNHVIELPALHEFFAHFNNDDRCLGRRRSYLD